MIHYTYKKDDFADFSDGIRREWALTNGIGGYAGSSLIGAHNRTHQGYLIASLHPPVERYLVFSKINETLDCGNTQYSLETSQHSVDGKTVYTEGQTYLDSFTYDGSIHYTYCRDAITLQKHICLKPGENLCAVAYEIENTGNDSALELVPLFNFREHNESSTKDTLKFDTSCSGKSFFLTPKQRPDVRIQFQVSEGTYTDNEICYDLDMQLQTEVDLETDGLDSHYCPVKIQIDLPAGCSKKISVLCSVAESASALPLDIDADSAFSVLAERETYVQRLFDRANYKDNFANQLVLAADSFICDRVSTGLKTVLAGLPWFTDWGRDTMIAFTGLTLCTGRHEEAKEILLTFAKYVRNGIIPNMFPDNDAKPLYNTADASLWYFYAVYQYLQYNPSEEAWQFVYENIYPCLKEILHAYKNGTDFSIYMDEDGLIHAGSGLDQITWMDVRVGDWVATPRHGKPVEINALWYNAIKVMEHFASKYGEDTMFYQNLAKKVKDSFCRKFWNETWGCLYDVVDGDEVDDHLRPNQIYAVSLPFTMLTEEQEASIVSVVEQKLFVGCGLRSLSADHKEYHGIYCGALPKRDAAYHQGTAWGFLLGGFFTAYTKVHHHSPESIQHAVDMLEPIRRHLLDNGCIGSVSEIFDGDAPHNPRGCYAQAWSIGEVLRCYTQDILPYL